MSLIIAAAFFVLGCTSSTYSGKDSSLTSFQASRLDAILAAQPEKTKARFQYRHPRETLEFFGIAPGMTVVEALPGGGWYSKILIPYLGSEGMLIGADYSQAMYPKFGFFTDEQLKAKETWVRDWTAEASGWSSGDAATVRAFAFGAMPADLAGTADAVLFIRALHNLHRFENDGGFLTAALADAYRVLKFGGIVGIVQHRAPENTSAASTTGSRGYLKTSDLMAFMEKAGFEYVDASEINANPKDQATESEVVWRLPPTLFTSR
ncbi:MAG: class I SAM-dependent methyltransferase, partial [Gammaproteobacteria bacterium]|nr:class I SAM-dependent methyltransferase [Gammaproteobacteria bacterium]